MRAVRGRARGVLFPEEHGHLWRARPGGRLADLRGLFGLDRGERAFCVADAGRAGCGQGGAVAVRRHHHVLAAQALGRGRGHQARRGGLRRARPHGGEAGGRDGRGGDGVHDLAGEGERRGRPGRAPCCAVQGRRSDEGGAGEPRHHHRQRSRRARPAPLYQQSQGGRHARDRGGDRDAVATWGPLDPGAHGGGGKRDRGDSRHAGAARSLCGETDLPGGGDDPHGRDQ